MKLDRRRLLLFVLGLLVGGYLLNMLVDRLYVQPLAAESKSAANLQKRISELQQKVKRLTAKVPQRDELEDRALPAELELATSSYQTWLINLVSSLGLGNPNVDSTSPVRDKGHTRLQFNVRGKANLKQLTQLLFEFYRAGSLHKVRQISLTPTSNNDQLELQLSVEALSLDRSRNVTGLTSLTSNRLRFDSVAEYQPIAKRNLFGEGTVSAGIRAARLTAITSDRQGIAEAWISLGADAKTLLLKAGDSTLIDSVEVIVREIQSDSVKLELDGQPGTVEVGKSLAEIKLAQ
jgi:hypothetical protein